MPYFRGSDGVSFERYKQPHHVAKGLGPTEARTAGAMTHKQQVQRLLAAGAVQGAWRRKNFPPEINIEDDFQPLEYAPTELDLLDEQRRILNGRARSPGEARKQVAEAKAAAAEPPVEPEVPDDPGD